MTDISISDVNHTSNQSLPDSEEHKPMRKKLTTKLAVKKPAPSLDNEVSPHNTAIAPQYEADESEEAYSQSTDNYNHSCNRDENGAPAPESSGNAVHSSEPPMVFYTKDLRRKKPEDLLDLATSLQIDNPSALNKHELIFSILRRIGDNNATIIGDGVLEVTNDGFGFLRSSCVNYESSPDDVYVSPNIIRKMGLRTGEILTGELRAPKKGEKYFALARVDTVSGQVFDKMKKRIHFEDLTPLYPNKQLIMANPNGAAKDMSGRIIDIVAPLGKGQRALIVAPPRTGKTILMENIAHAITANNPDIELIALLIGERPEEVTDMKRSIKGEVVSSTFDEPCQRHVQLAEIVIEKAKRMVENKKDVVILLDSITRLARAYNNTAPSSGKVLTGGVDSNALQRPKRFFGAARNIENGGSLTIIATALIETGSRMDEVIFEEFKGTGNAEIVLDRKISDKRIFPAIDLNKSGTRKEDLFFESEMMSKIWVLRRILNPMGTVDAVEFLIDKLSKTKNNHDFFQHMNRA